MKSLYFSMALAFTSTLLCSTLSAKEDYTMPSGRVLHDAYIMERKPNGVTVGHSTGVMFVKYNQMTPEMRKQLGYDEKACAEYETKKRKHNAAVRKRRAAEKAEKAKLDKKLEKRREQYRITELEDKIKATELHIKRMKAELPKLEAESKNYLNDAVKLSSVTTSSGDRTYWRSGTWSSSSSSNRSTNRSEVKKRYRAVSALGDEYSKTKFRIENYRDSIERKTLELEKMKRELKRLKKKQKSKSGGFLTSLF